MGLKAGAVGGFGGGTALTGISIGIWAINDAPWWLDALGIVSAISAAVFFIVMIVCAWLLVQQFVRNYFDGAKIGSNQWFCRYWPHEKLLSIHGPIVLGNTDHRPTIRCRGSILGTPVDFTQDSNSGTLGDFGQRPFSLDDWPVDGGAVTLEVHTKLKWWQGRDRRAIVTARFEITDHRPQPTPDMATPQPTQAE